jgi:hypothetical protein
MAQETTVAVKINASTGGTESVKSLKAQIREATNEAVLLAQKFGEFSPEAQQAAARVADLKDQMEDFGLRVKGLNPDKFQRIADIGVGVARGMQAATGAMQLFGIESEAAQQALLKVQAATAFAEGVQGIKDLDKNMGGFISKTIQGFKGIKGAIATTGIGLLVVALGALVAMWDEVSESLKSTAGEVKKVNKAMNEAQSATRSQTLTIDYYRKIVVDTNKTEQERKGALGELKKLGVETDDINIANANSLDELNKRSESQIKLIEIRARVQAASEILNEKTKAAIKAQTASIEEYNKWWIQLGVVAASSVSNVAGAAVKAGADMTKTNLKLADQKKTQEEVNVITKLYVKELENLKDLEIETAGTKNKVKSTLDLQAAAQKAATDAVQDNIEKQEELKQKSAELREQAELIGKSEIEQQKILALRRFNANIEGFKEGSAEYLAALKIYIDEVDKLNKEQTEKEQAELDARKAAREKFIEDSKAITDKEIADTIADVDKLYAIKKNQLTLQGATQAEFDQLEIQRLEAQLREVKEYGELTKDETLRIEAELATKRKEIRDKDVADAKAAEEAKRQMQMDTLGAISSALGSLADLSGKNEKAQKAFALAQIATDTAIALSNASATAFSPASPDNAVTGGLAGVAKYASFVAIILSNAARARQILKGGGGGGAGGNAPATPNAPQTTPITGGTLPDTEAGQFAGMGKVYVLEGDITKTQTRVRRVRNVSVV